MVAIPAEGLPEVPEDVESLRRALDQAQENAERMVREAVAAERERVLHVLGIFVGVEMDDDLKALFERAVNAIRTGKDPRS